MLQTVAAGTHLARYYNTIIRRKMVLDAAKSEPV